MGYWTGRILLRPFELVEGGTATSPSTAFVNGVVTGIRLLVVIILKRVLRAAMMAGYRIRHTGTGLSRGVQTDLHIGAMGQFDLEPTTVCPGG
jgi:hypothetical protein